MSFTHLHDQSKVVYLKWVNHMVHNLHLTKARRERARERDWSWILHRVLSALHNSNFTHYWVGEWNSSWVFVSLSFLCSPKTRAHYQSRWFALACSAFNRFLSLDSKIFNKHCKTSPLHCSVYMCFWHLIRKLSPGDTSSNMKTMISQGYPYYYFHTTEKILWQI